MKDPRKQRFAGYLRALADLLALRDWHVEIVDAYPNDGAQASIETLYGRRRAMISLSEEFLADDPAGQRQALAHELIHCHVDTLYRVGHDAVPKDVECALHRLMEHCVDGLADAIAPLLPLPPEPRHETIDQ
jgi:hypothetical protein